MAEDNMIGKALMKLGLRHSLSPFTAVQPLGIMSLVDFVQRRSRWIRIRLYTMPATFFVEPLTECLVCGVVGAFSLSYVTGVDAGLCVGVDGTVTVL